MISSQALIDKFRFALDNHWGYIWGTAGIMWTQAKQDQKVAYMVSQYGKDWQKNAEAKKDNYYSAAVNGSKWIGHTVADCSGLFAWAFKQLGGAIAHGSNSIYDRYCTSKKGKLTDALKKTILPGTAVFTGDSSGHGHIGLYVGDGKVIEASGTIAGVCVSNITAGKWTYYGELKGVDYTQAGENQPIPAPSAPVDEQTPVTNLPTLKRGNKGEYVKQLQQKLISKGYPLPRYGADGDFGAETESAVKQFQRNHGLTGDGIVGPKTWAALDGEEKQTTYTVTVKGATKAVADEIQAKYGGVITAE